MFFQKHDLFVKPEEVHVPLAVGYFLRINKSTGNIAQAMRTISFQYVPIKPLLKVILENGSTWQHITEYTPREDGLMEDFQDGSFVK